MLDFGVSFLAWLAATAGPAFLGLLLITAAGRSSFNGKYLAAFALGIFLWFFVDTIGGSANLDVNAGFTGGVDQVAIVALFVIGLLFFLSVSGDLLSPESGIGKYGLTVPILVAIAVGMHGFGEGTAFGATASSTPSASLLDAFGGLTAGVAYALHKALEPMMIGACYIVYALDRAKNKPIVRYIGDILVLTILFVVPSLIGAATGYYISYDASYFFALGTGTSIYVALRLARPLFLNMEASGSSRESVKSALLIAFGFLCIYFAALFHA
jgi:zinc transporter ZupT